MALDEEIPAQQVGADHLVELARRDDTAEARGDLRSSPSWALDR
jgi:hypothetical protein